METTNWMYRGRDFSFVTVSTDRPSDSAAVLKILQDQHAGNMNLQFATTDAKEPASRFCSKVEIKRALHGGNRARRQGYLSKSRQAGLLLLTRRYVLANLPDKGDGFAGVQAYWTSVINGGQ